MLDKAEDYFKDEEFVGYFVEVVTDVLIGSDVSGCEDMTLQDVSDNETIKTESNT